ncbi:MAG: hypothetical protein AAGG75_11060 [Bacteroidota bacterium]
MKHFFILFVLGAAWTSPAQHPLDFGQTDSIYFLSSTQIDSFDIEFIHIIDVLAEEGGMNEPIDLKEIDFTTHSISLSDKWFACYDSLTQAPILDSIINHSIFINGEYWMYKNGFLTESGGEGYGTLCQLYYERLSDHTLIEQMCKRSSVLEYHKNYYHKNGLLHYSVCCDQTDESEEEGELEEDSSYQVYNDTLYYLYDQQWKYVGSKKNDAVVLPIFHYDFALNSPFYQAYVNKEPMEQFVEKHIGYKPQRILMEIYNKGALNFLYSAEHEKYYQGFTIILE